MTRFTKPLLGSALVLTLVFATGCEDPKVRISQLEESNQQLLDQLQAAQDDLMACRGANDNCQRDLAMARADLENGQAEELPDGWQAVPGGAMIAIEGSVLFDSGKVKLRKGARSTLEQVVSALSNQYGAKDILVFGHTDDQPIKKSGWQDNFELSTERALSVVRFLKDRGVAPERLAACGVGKYRPRVPNDSKGNRQQNRRVEIFALDAEVRTAGR